MMDTLAIYRDVLRASLATSDVAELDSMLSASLREVQLEEGTLLPQMLLLDSRHTIANAIVLPPADFDDERRARLEEWRLSLLGYRFDREVSEHTSYLALVDEATGLRGGPAQVFLSACEPVRVSPSGLIGNYDVYTLDPVSDDPTKFSRKVRRAEISIASGRNARLLADVGMTDWFSNIVMSIIAPGPSDSGSRMYGVLAFLYRPSDRQDLCQDRIDHLFKIKERIVSLSSFLQAAQFAAWTQALSQASASQPCRLTTELLRIGWTKAIENAATTHLTQGGTVSEPTDYGLHELRRLLTTVLNVPNPLAMRTALRDVLASQSNPNRLAIITLEHFAMLLGGAMQDSRDWEPALEHVKTVLPPYQNDDMEAFWRGQVQNTLAAVVENLRCLYPHVDPKIVNDCFRRSLLPLIKSALDTAKDHSWIWDGLTDSQRFGLAFTALTDGYPYADSVTWAGMSDILEHHLGCAMRDKEALEAAIEVLLEGLLKSDESTSGRLIASWRDLLSKWDRLTGGEPFRVAHKLFNLLSSGRRYALLASISDSGLVCGDQFAKANWSQSTLLETREMGADALTPLEITSVVSSKGGVGKSTVALALAVALAKRRGPGKKVCLIDLDMFGPTLAYGSRATIGSPMCYLNEVVWARFLADLEQQQLQPESDISRWLSQVFKHRKYWRTRFEKLSGETDLLSQLLVVPKDLPGLHLLLCAPEEDLQDLTLPFLETPTGRKAFKAQIFRLLLELRDAGFVDVVIDSPAELKELALDATQLSSLHRGKTVFVTTLSQNSVDPMLTMMASGYNVVGSNYLVVNKLRSIDARYLKTKDSFLDYLTAARRQQNGSCLAMGRYSLLAALLTAEQCGALLYSEELENSMSRRSDSNENVFDVIAECAATQVNFLID